MNNIVGQKVVCINAAPNPEYPHYGTPLKQGAVYVVSSLKFNKFGIAGYRLIGLNPPPDFKEQTFHTSRFRLLSELKREAKAEKRQLVSA